MPVNSGLSYGPVGATRPGEQTWSTGAPGFRCFERTAVIGHGAARWAAAADAVLRWDVKRRSGFRVTPCGGAGERVSEGDDYRITAGRGPYAVHEPVRVVSVVETADRCGFAYGTLPGHPVSGEEAFIVHRDSYGTVRLTLRSLTRPAPHGPWRQAFPFLLLAQWFYRRRYLRAMAS
jgi:uncharacterized protein (UPF0548 family)